MISVGHVSARTSAFGESVMSLSCFVRRWWHLPSRIALLVGFGALSATAAKAETPQPVRVPQQSAKSFGELRIWSEAGRIYVAEFGKEGSEIQLGNTAEARHLRELLERNGATKKSPRVLSDRIILVGGGGSGTHSWTPAEKDRTPEKSNSPAATGFGPQPTGTVAQPTGPERSGAANTGTTRAPKKG